MIDTTQLKERIDLRQFARERLGEAVYRGSKNLSYKCCFHHEKHGNSLAIYQNGWRCFGACQEGGDAINFIMKYDGIDFKEAVRMLGGDPDSMRVQPRKPVQYLPPIAEPPGNEWQQIAGHVVQAAVANLWQPVGVRALEYLMKTRALSDYIIQDAQLGYVPGVPGEWVNFHGMHLPAGITIPWIADGLLWGIKVRTSSPDKALRYRQPAGGNLAGGLYFGDEITPGLPLLIVEGEFNALTVLQYGLNLNVVSLGSASTTINTRWISRLATCTPIYCLTDDDPAGNKSAQRVASASKRVKLIHLPAGIKDLNDFEVMARDTDHKYAVFHWLVSVIPELKGGE